MALSSWFEVGFRGDMSHRAVDNFIRCRLSLACEGVEISLLWLFLLSVDSVADTAWRT